MNTRMPSPAHALFAVITCLLVVTLAVGPKPAPLHVDASSTKALAASPPNIECKWELPDMQSGVTDTTFPDGTVQYDRTGTTPLHIHDDDMTVVPDADNNSANGTQIPCQGPPGALPSIPDGVRHMVQVRPNADDFPLERITQLWAAVDHPNGIGNISDVFWKVFHPDGTFKVQVHGTKVAVADCGNLGNSTTARTMFESAVHTGQVAAAAVDDVNKGLIARCQQQAGTIYYAKFQVSKEQPCGQYKIELHAVSSGTEKLLTNYLDILCFFNLRIDFNKVDWGPITPGATDIVSGDLLFNPPTDASPTVKNTGNHGMGVGVKFTSMAQAYANGVLIPGGKTIDQFDAVFGKSPATMQVMDPIAAGTVAQFDNDPARVLCANEIGKLDLSIHPPSTLPEGHYVGNVQVLARSVHNVCATDQESSTNPPAPDSSIPQYHSVDINTLAKTLGAAPTATRVVIPAIGVDAPVVELNVVWDGDSRVWQRPKDSIGHHVGTANPGELGNSVMSGHVNSPVRGEGSVFRRLPEIPALLDNGEKVEIFVYTPTAAYVYRVVKTEVVKPDALDVFAAADKPTLTLITCVPDVLFTDRLIVISLLEKMAEGGIPSAGQVVDGFVVEPRWP